MDNQIYLIMRADDCGSNQTVNKAMIDVVNSGFNMMRNVSLMANGFEIEDAAHRFADYKDLCFGVHLTMNAEWDDVRWGPVSSKQEIPSLIDSEGYLYKTPQMFQKVQVNMDEVFVEMTKQIEKLKELGFTISYADEHMRFGDHLPGYEARFNQWCEELGVVNWRSYIERIPVLSDDNHLVLDNIDEMIERLELVNSGTYTIVTHPAFESAEMLQLGNSGISGETINTERNQDRLLLKSKKLIQYCQDRKIQFIRYNDTVSL